MRDPQRIERILAIVNKLWQEFPDWRLGQLLANAVPDYETSLFFVEDTVAEEGLNNLKDISGEERSDTNS